MRKLNFNIFKSVAILGLAASTFLVSCERELEPDYPAIQAKPVVAFESTSYEVKEGKDIEITLVSNVALNDVMNFQLDVVKATSTAKDHDDFELSLDNVDLDWGTVNSYRIDFPAFQKQFKFTLSAFVDDFSLNEGDEVVYLRIIPRGTLNGEVNPSASEAKITILQRGDNIVEFVGGWEVPFNFGGNTYTLYDIGYDIDFLYADSNMNIVDYFGSFDQMPEVAEVDIEEWGQGTWHVFNTVYETNGLETAGIPTFLIPITLEYSRFGSGLVGTYVQDSANAYDSDTPSDPNALDARYVYSFTINADDTVTVFDVTTGMEIGTGRSVATPKSLNSIKPKGLENLARRR